MRLALGLAAVATALQAAPSFAAEVKVEEIVVAKTIPAVQRDAELKAAKAFYQFWNTDDADLLKTALSPGFTDRALPPGRPQGSTGPPFASEHFRASVPDLSLEAKR
jgi:hypothetical protein